MNFDRCNFFLKIWKSIGTPTFKVRAHLGVCGFVPSHSPALPGAWNVTPMLHSWPALLQALNLVVSLRLRLQQDWNINISNPMEPQSHYKNLHWIILANEFVPLFHCQILIGSVMINAFVIIKYLLMITIIVIPLVLAHLVNS